MYLRSPGFSLKCHLLHDAFLTPHLNRHSSPQTGAHTHTQCSDLCQFRFHSQHLVMPHIVLFLYLFSVSVFQVDQEFLKGRDYLAVCVPPSSMNKQILSRCSVNIC